MTLDSGGRADGRRLTYRKDRSAHTPDSAPMPSLSFNHELDRLAPAHSTAAVAERQANADDGSLWQAVCGPPRLTPAELGALQRLAQTRSVRAGDMVFTRRDPARHLVVLWRGDVGLGHDGADGHFQLERTVKGPAWLDAWSAWLGEGHLRDARALTAATVLSLPCAGVRQLLDRQPVLARRLLAALSRQVQDLAETVHDLMHRDAESRLAVWLLQHSALQAHPGETLQVRLGERKRDIAAQLGITPETLSRTMRALSGKGLIDVAGYTVRVLNLAALRQLAT